VPSADPVPNQWHYMSPSAFRFYVHPFLWLSPQRF